MSIEELTVHDMLWMSGLSVFAFYYLREQKKKMDEESLRAMEGLS